jgi:hypothetical protein
MLLDRLGNGWVLPTEFRSQDIQIGLLPDEFIRKFPDHFRGGQSSIRRGPIGHFASPGMARYGPALSFQAPKLIFANVP